MKNELLMVIADAIARTSANYDFEIGKRGMVALSTEIHDAVVDHLNDEPFAEPEFFDEDGAQFGSISVPDGDAEAYDEGYNLGYATAQKSPLEIYDAVIGHAEFRAAGGEPEAAFEEGFRDGMESAGHRNG